MIRDPWVLPRIGKNANTPKTEKGRSAKALVFYTQ